MIVTQQILSLRFIIFIHFMPCSRENVDGNNLRWIKLNEATHTLIYTHTHRRETTGFTMSVGRLAEPPKPSFLLLCEVSQSHPFMCDACKPMHSDTMAQQRDMAVEAGEGRGGRVRMGCYQNVSEQTSTKGQQQYSKCQYLAMRRATGAAGAAQQTLRRAEEQHRGELLVTRSART